MLKYIYLNAEINQAPAYWLKKNFDLFLTIKRSPELY